MKIYEYAVIYQPKRKKDEDSQPAKLIVPVTQILAENDKNAMLMAARAIPEEYIPKLDQCEVAVRPF